MQDQRAWIDETVVELRLRDVRGEAIGDAVAQVESHCADSGERPQQAFGDPREYARRLEFSPDDLVDGSPREWIRAFTPVITGLVGFSVFLDVVTAVLRHEPVVVSRGDVVAAAAFVVLLVALTRFLRAMLESPLNTALMFGGAGCLLVAPPMLWRTPVAAVPWWAGLLVAVPALAASVVTARSQRDQGDPVVVPFEGDRYGSGSSRHATARRVATEWVFVIASVVVGLLLWALYVGLGG